MVASSMGLCPFGEIKYDNDYDFKRSILLQSKKKYWLAKVQVL